VKAVVHNTLLCDVNAWVVAAGKSKGKAAAAMRMTAPARLIFPRRTVVQLVYLRHFRARETKLVPAEAYSNCPKTPHNYANVKPAISSLHWPRCPSESRDLLPGRLFSAFAPCRDRLQSAGTSEE
jgi:hypothetical protein